MFCVVHEDILYAYKMYGEDKSSREIWDVEPRHDWIPTSGSILTSSRILPLPCILKPIA